MLRRNARCGVPGCTQRIGQLSIKQGYCPKHKWVDPAPLEEELDGLYGSGHPAVREELAKLLTEVAKDGHMLLEPYSVDGVNDRDKVFAYMIAHHFFALGESKGYKEGRASLQRDLAELLLPPNGGKSEES
jgi:hypothetical protein